MKSRNSVVKAENRNVPPLTLRTHRSSFTRRLLLVEIRGIGGEGATSGRERGEGVGRVLSDFDGVWGGIELSIFLADKPYGLAG